MESAGSDQPVFIGDELTAAGYRLAGARVQTPALEDVGRSFAELEPGAGLILITAEYAARLPPGALDRAIARGALVAVVPDVRQRAALPDVAARLRRELGMES
jgi:vacuolar-type H+-ATPase subunit F/Vma7